MYWNTFKVVNNFSITKIFSKNIVGNCFPSHSQYSLLLTRMYVASKQMYRDHMFKIFLLTRTQWRTCIAVCYEFSVQTNNTNIWRIFLFVYCSLIYFVIIYFLWNMSFTFFLSVYSYPIKHIIQQYFCQTVWPGNVDVHIKYVLYMHVCMEQHSVNL